MPPSQAHTSVAEADLIRRAAAKDEAAVREIIKTYNRRLYRVARSVVRDDSEAEDVLQEAYLRAFSALPNFRGDASLATWLTRIVLNEALQRLRRRTEMPLEANEEEMQAQIIPFPLSARRESDPETNIAQRQICKILEQAIDELPEEFRLVLVARVIEDMSIAETAAILGVKPETVKTRLHRARQLLKAALTEQVGPLFSEAFPFEGARCDRVTEAVILRLKLSR